MSSLAAGDSVDNVLYRHRAAVRIQRWYRLLLQRRRDHNVSTSEQSVRRMLDAKRQELLRQRDISTSVADNSDDKDWRREKEEKARLARQQAIQVCFAVTYLLNILCFTERHTCADGTLASCLIYAWALPAHPYNA